jgi:ubiquinone/menaquinone biosynthesis C-methylase UbiE
MDALKDSREGRGHAGITLRAFRLNAAANHIMFTGRRGRVYDRIVRLSGARPGDSVLDVGSSSGYLARRLASAVAPSGHVTGVDPAEPAIEYARRHAGPGMTFTVGIAQDLNVPDASFDVVTCTLAMHHIPAGQRQAAFDDMTSLLHLGGRGGGPFEDLAATAGYRIESAGKLPLLGYIVAVRPKASA